MDRFHVCCVVSYTRCEVRGQLGRARQRGSVRLGRQATHLAALPLGLPAAAGPTTRADAETFETYVAQWKGRGLRHGSAEPVAELSAGQVGSRTLAGPARPCGLHTLPTAGVPADGHLAL